MTISQIVTLSMLSLLALTLLIYLCLRKILPLLGVIKNRMLIEEDGEIVMGTADRFVQPPPSSDRTGLSGGKSEEKRE